MCISSMDYKNGVFSSAMILYTMCWLQIAKLFHSQHMPGAVFLQYSVLHVHRHTTLLCNVGAFFIALGEQCGEKGLYSMVVQDVS